MSNVNEKNLVLTRAQGAVIARDFQTAARLYKQLLKDDPSNVDYLKEIGAIYVKAGEDEKAIPYYEQIITFYPHYIDAMNSLGAIFRRLKRYEESIEILQKALDEGRQSASVNYNLGFTYKEMGNYDDAIDAFEMVIGENPSDVLAHNHLGMIYLAKKQYQKSIAAFKRGLQIDQNHPILNYNLACCYREAKQYQDAIRCFEAALKVKPGWIDAIKDYSNLLVKCQKTKEASDLVKHSIELHPNDSKLLSILGKIYLEQYDYDSAAKTFKKANNVDNDNIEILTGLAESLEKGEKPLEALDAVSKALEIAPDDKTVKKQYVHTLLSAEEYDSAGSNVQDLYEDNGQADPQVLDLYGQYCICVDDEVQAGQYFDKIGEVNRHYKDHLLSAAERYAQKGNYSQAERFAKDYVSKNINNPSGYNTLGSIYSKEGNVEQAIETFNKSQSLKKPNVMAEKQVALLKNKLAAKPEEVKAPEPSVSETSDAALEKPVESAAENQKDEGFDFGSMGDNVPMGEALLEKENDFFDELDKELESDELENEEENKVDEEEADPEITSSENKNQNAASNENGTGNGSGEGNGNSSGTGEDSASSNGTEGSDSDETGASGKNGTGEDSPSDYDSGFGLPGKNPFDFDDADEISPFQDFENSEPKSQAEQLVPDADFSDSDDSLTDENSDPFGFNGPATGKTDKSENEVNPFDMAPPDTSSASETPAASGYGNNENGPAAESGNLSGTENAAGNGNGSGNGNPFESGTGSSYGDGSPENSAGNLSSGDDSGFVDNIDGSDNFDFDQFDDSYASEPENNSGASGGYSNNPYGNSGSGYGAPSETYGDSGKREAGAVNGSSSGSSGAYNDIPDYNLQSKFAQEMERRAQEVARQSAQYAMDAAMDAQKIARDLSSKQDQLKEQLDSLDNAFKTEKEAEKNPIYVPSETQAASEEKPSEPEAPAVESPSLTADDIYEPSETQREIQKTPVNPEEASELYDSAFGDTSDLNSDETELSENDISPETEEAFAYDNMMDNGFEEDFENPDSQVLSEQNALDGSSEEIVNSEELTAPEEKTEIAEPLENDEGSAGSDGADIPEIDATDEAETVNPASLVQPMADSFEEPEAAESGEEENPEDEGEEDENQAELDLFKKLRSLCDFVPDSERQSNNYDNMRSRIEYIISRMSGKQGLLKTAEEYAPEEVLKACNEESSVNGELDQDLLAHVLLTMKNLAASLEDKSVTQALCTKADELIRRLDI